jgi:hypothetical protein
MGMIILTLSNGQIRQFNFPSSTREAFFRNAWYAMAGDPKFSYKTFKIVTSDGDVLHYKIGEIKNCRVMSPEPVSV